MGGGRRDAPRLPRPGLPFLLVLLVLVGAGAAVFLVLRHKSDTDRQRQDARTYIRAWAAGDADAMWKALDADSRRRYPLARFRVLVANAQRAAGVRERRAGAVSDPRKGVVTFGAAAVTDVYGTLRGTIRLAVGDSEGGVRWRPELRLPGVRPGEEIRRVVLAQPSRGKVLDRDGKLLAAQPVLQPFVAGLEKRYAERLRGRPGSELRFGSRVIGRVPARSGRSIHSTLRPGLQQVAQQALGGKLGGVAVLNPRDGSALALAGIAVSAPQPPGSTFKIITLAGALQAGIASPSSTFPVRTAATLSGVRLANASNEECGGTLVRSFADSCNSVFAPLGARLGAKRLVSVAKAFGFGEEPRIPAAKPSTLPDAEGLPDAIALGSAAIGQGTDLATPLGMASVAATIGEEGVRAKPRAISEDPVMRKRAVSAKVARQVREMMLGVVQSGTGTAAAIPGVQVAGKTGTAELRATGTGKPDPRNTDAWFVAFAPAGDPKVAVAVMLVGAGAGGSSAAPIARQVLQAALG